MTKLNKKIKTALNEARILILGTQVLLGFQYRAFFERNFEALPSSSKYLQLTGLGVLLFAMALLMWPSAYHRIVRQGNDATDLHDFTSSVMDLAVFPIMVALSIDFYVMGGKVWGTKGGVVIGSFIAATAFFFWYGLGFISRHRRWDPDAPAKSKDRRRAQMERIPAHEKIDQVLTEARMVLPGAQALLGFQFAIILLDAFDKLPQSSRNVHLASLVLMGVTVILLMTPAAYHRIVERGEDTEHFHDVASRFLIITMIFLPLGICGDLYIVALKVTGSESLAVAGALLALAFSYALWFGYTTYRRAQLKSNA